MKTTEFQLKNGLCVILTESHKSPVVSTQMWVRTGSADEKKKEEGISHFIEHLVFKGSRKFKVGEIASTIEGAGGELNAYTSFDQTVFYVTISKQFTDTGLTAIAEMMGFPTFDPTEIHNEREVVVEEIKRGKDSLGRKASELLFSTAFKKHPYGLPVIGYEKNVRAWSAKKIVQYYNSRYAPRNMFLLVSGDFDSKEMKKKVSQLFGEIQDYKVKKIKRQTEPKQTKVRHAVEKAEFEQSLVYLAWKIPAIHHRDIPALDILGAILGQGDSSRLVQKLRIQSATVNSVSASSYTMLDSGLFNITFGYQKENLDKALSGLYEVLQQILLEESTQPVLAEEIQRAVLSIESEEYYGLETVDGLSRRMGSLQFYFKDLKAQDKYLKAVKKVTIADILRVARKYLQIANLNCCAVTNDDIRTVDQKLKQWVKDFSQTVDKAAGKHKVNKLTLKPIHHAKIETHSIAAKNKQAYPQTEKIILDNGMTVLLRPSNETQVLSVKAAYMGGLREEDHNQQGLTELLSRTWACGTLLRTEDQISMQMESMAAGLGANSGRNSIGLSLEVLNGFQQAAADLFLDVLTHPQFPENFVQREKMIQAQQIKSRADNPSQVCVQKFMQAMFIGHAYAKDMLGTEASLQNMSSADLRKYWQKICGTRNLTIVLSGHLQKGLWLDQLQKQLASIPEGKRLLQSQPVQPLLENTEIFTSIVKEQSHVIYGFRGLPLSSPDRYALQVMESILAGQGGRLFLRLRDQNSLAYSVSPLRMEGIETGYFGAYIGCSPEKVKKAITMMKEQFTLLCEDLVGDEELQRAQRYLVGRHDIDLQRNSSVGSAILYNDVYGIDYNEAFNSAKNYFAVTAKDVQKLACQIFAQKHVISVVGPQEA